MSKKQWGHGFHNGIKEGIRMGEQSGEAKTQMDLGMKALCLATAIRAAQKEDTVAQYVLTEVLIDMLADQTGGRIDQCPQHDDPVAQEICSSGEYRDNMSY